MKQNVMTCAIYQFFPVVDQTPTKSFPHSVPSLPLKLTVVYRSDWQSERSAKILIVSNLTNLKLWSRKWLLQISN